MPKDENKETVRQKDADELHGTVIANAGLNLNTSSLLTELAFRNVFGSDGVTDNGSIQVANKKILIDDCEDDTDWTARGEASNLITSVVHTEGTKSLSFDKSGVGGTVGYIDKTFTSLDLKAFQTHAILHMHVYLSDVSQVIKVFLRIGTDSSNYHQYDFLVVETGWNDLDMLLTGRTSQTGNGANSSDISYVAVGIEMAANGHTLIGILVDNVTTKRVTEVLSYGVEAVELATKVRIQDNNTGRLLEINTSKEALVHETDAASIKTAVESINGTLDITTSSLRDAIRGANTKDFSTIQTVLDSIKNTDGIKKITDTVTVTATDLDIRDLSKAQDEIYSVLRTDAGVAYDARDRNWTITESVPVTGTFWQVTQPVSGTVTVTDVSDIKTAVQKIDNQEDSITWVHVVKGAIDGDIIAAPGIGNFIRVHHIYVSNEGSNFTIFEIGEAVTPKWRFPLAAEGGIVAQNLKRPWDLGNNVALHYDYKSGGLPAINITIGYEIISV